MSSATILLSALKVNTKDMHFSEYYYILCLPKPKNGVIRKFVFGLGQGQLIIRFFIPTHPYKKSDHKTNEVKNFFQSFFFKVGLVLKTDFITLLIRVTNQLFVRKRVFFFFFFFFFWIMIVSLILFCYDLPRHWMTQKKKKKK